MVEKALSSSVKAAIIGLILVMLFMILNYSLSGVVASIGLAIYTTVTVALIYLFEITLTLPGIAGVILGIGMAVDANVIIISRIREEIAAGKSVLTSIKTGYKKAMSAIIDGNVTTFIAALVLMWLWFRTVKGICIYTDYLPDCFHVHCTCHFKTVKSGILCGWMQKREIIRTCKRT